MTSVLVTGASGFIGTHLLPRLSSCRLRLALRNPQQSGARNNHEVMFYNPVEAEPDYSGLLQGVDVVIHLAGMAHARADTRTYRELNINATARLAEESVKSGVKRFVFLSTVKVHGECTTLDAGHYAAFTADSPLAPGDDYSISKAEAEQGLMRVCASSSMQYVVLRPPLVYGPGVRANFLQLMKWVHRGIPLPFSNIENRRSFIYVENLANLIHRCIDHPAAANRALLIKDYDESTPGLIRTLARSLGIHARLFPVPTGVLSGVGKLTGQHNAIRRLTESLSVDDSAMRKLLNWTPSIDNDSAFARTADWFKQGQPPPDLQYLSK